MDRAEGDPQQIGRPIRNANMNAGKLVGRSLITSAFYGYVGIRSRPQILDRDPHRDLLDFGPEIFSRHIVILKTLVLCGLVALVALSR